MNDGAQDEPHAARLARWVSEHGPAVQGYLHALVRDRHLAEDLAQEVFCRAWQARHRYADHGKERAYLLRIADRLARDRLRRRRRETPLGGPLLCEDSSGLPDDRLERIEAQRQLHAALDQLTDPQRRTLLLRYFGPMEFHEIAAVLDCPLGTVLSHGRRALLAMRRLLAGKSS